MGIKIGSSGYAVPPVHRIVHVGTKKPMTREEREQEYKNMRKAIAIYKGASIDVRI